jgi:6-pyruvoyl-tetrahydropterin synthase
MKKPMIRKEGVKMNDSLNFENYAAVRHQFHFVLETIETAWGLYIQYHYRITEDKYIQIAVSVEDDAPQIRAQYQLKYSSVKENIKFVITEMFDANLLFNGYPQFHKSNTFSEKEFKNDLIEKLKNEKRLIYEKTKTNQTPLIKYLKEQDLEPNPSETNVGSWVAKCPNGQKHFIMITTKNDQWGCGYCKKKGGLQDLQNWINQLHNN